MIITPNFQCVLSIVGEKDKKILLMKCDEESLKLSIELMHTKLNQENYEEGVKFRNAINNLGNLNINNQFEKLFWPILSAKLIFAKLFNDGSSLLTNSAALKIKPNLSICSLHSLSI